MRMIDRFTFHWSHAVVCCSEAVRRSVSNCLPAPGSSADDHSLRRRCRSVCGGRCRQQKELRLRDGGPIVGTVCRLAEPKKGYVLLRAMATLNPRGNDPRCQLLIVGEGPARESLGR